MTNANTATSNLREDLLGRLFLVHVDSTADDGLDKLVELPYGHRYLAAFHPCGNWQLLMLTCEQVKHRRAGEDTQRHTDTQTDRPIDR